MNSTVCSTLMARCEKRSGTRRGGCAQTYDEVGAEDEGALEDGDDHQVAHAFVGRVDRVCELLDLPHAERARLREDGPCGGSAPL